MKLSIIIPVYNEAPYLRRCLNSVFAAKNGYSDVEVIVVDDGSTDGSSEICDEYEYFTVYHTVNQGVSAARNIGKNYAMGEWLFFMDSDDAMLPFGIAHLLAAMDKDYPVIQVEHYRNYGTPNKLVMKYKNEHRFYEFGIMPLCWYAVWNKLYKREAIADIYFDTDVHYGEDELFNLQVLSACGGVKCVDGAAIVRHFENKNSLNHTKGKAELLLQTRKLVELIAATDDKYLTSVVRMLLANHWSSDTYKRVLGTELVGFCGKENT